MNSRDQQNLEFIKSLSTAELNEWIDSASEDDVTYALELVNSDIEQLRQELIELKLENMDHYSDAVNIIRSIQL